MVKVPNITVEPPGPKAKAVIELDTKYLATSTKASPIAIERGEGSLIWDVDGNTYLDFASGVAVLNLGHSHPAVVKAVKQQVESFTHFAGTDYYYDVQSRLAERICSISNIPGEKRVFLSNSGTESNEAALKLARWSTQRKLFISFIGGFHGRTLGSLSLTASKAVQQERYFPSMPGVTHLPFAYCYRCPYHLDYPSCDIWCARVLDELHFEDYLPSEEVAAMFMEPVQGEGGYIVPPKEFVQIMHSTCKRHGILFVDDEVQAGMARTGRMWALEHHEVVPDIMCSAKALGSGVPIGATVFRKELDWGKKGSHSNTYGGNAIACAAALATIETIEKEGLVQQADRKGEHMRRRLEEMKANYEIIGDVRGLGLMRAAEFVKDRRTKEPAVKERDAIEELCVKRGLVAIGCGKSGIRIIPPLNISMELLDIGLDVLEGAIRDVGRNMGS
ncbi:MAG: acetyl ornithine aminotransferase family protein [Methanomassiliicoccales archaeon]|nr:acetyl ornithine aminotransferase family protein [Methanomassiliicoccales archaeon]